METKTVNVNVQIQMDITKGSDDVGQVQDVLELMNSAISKAGIKAEPQIFVSDISKADIIDSNSDDDNEDENRTSGLIVFMQGDKKSTKVELEINNNTTLTVLANEIIKAYDLKGNHLYGFSESTHSYFGNNQKYVKLKDEFLNPNDKECSKTTVNDAFNFVGKEMIFAYDFGDTKYFIVKKVS